MSKDLPKYHCNRDIKYLIIHCSASKITSNFSVAALRHLHVDINHWSDIGYHFYITKDGVIHDCRPVNITGAHCKGYNSCSIGICYVVLTPQEKHVTPELKSRNPHCFDFLQISSKFILLL